MMTNDLGANSLDDQELDRARKLFQSEPLTSTIKRLIYVDGWSKKDVPEAIKQYRNFLFLRKKYGHLYTLPPSVEIDDVWHAHILHTREYIKFCQDAFGYFLHHDPHSEGDLALADKKFQRLFEEETQKLYFKEFGEYIYAIRRVPINKRIRQSLKRLKKSFIGTKRLKEQYI